MEGSLSLTEQAKIRIEIIDLHYRNVMNDFESVSACKVLPRALVGEIEFFLQFLGLPRGFACRLELRYL
jgi:hypothetical protein